MRALVCALLVAGCADPVAATRAPAVYGSTDDRYEVYEYPAGVHRDLAETAVAMQISVDDLDQTNPANVLVTYTETLGVAEDLCTDVRYADQINPGWCSGTLIDATHILTAGHCVADTAVDCDGASYPWVFGIYYEAADTFHTLSTDDVYYCVGTSVWRNDVGADYAVIELDRPVVGHTPASIGAAAPIGAPVTMIGHPNGIPMKITNNATIRDDIAGELIADVDAFFGNSGSGVFDDSGGVVGILVSGVPRDYVRRQGAGCNEIYVIDPVPDGEGETLTKASVPIDLFCATPDGQGSPACDPVAQVDGGTPPSDAGTSVDAGTPVDGGSSETPDAGGVDAGAVVPRGGCSCRTSGRSTHGSALFAMLAVFVLGRRAFVRRKRDHTSAACRS